MAMSRCSPRARRGTASGPARGRRSRRRWRRAAWTTVRRHLVTTGATLTAVGGFTGWGGLIYVATHLAALWADPALLAEANADTARLAPLIAQDTAFDIIGWSAGCIGGLLCL